MLGRVFYYLLYDSSPDNRYRLLQALEGHFEKKVLTGQKELSIEDGEKIDGAASLWTRSERKMPPAILFRMLFKSPSLMFLVEMLFKILSQYERKYP